jgi:DNA-binding IclR family transcriptional regulator
MGPRSILRDEKVVECSGYAVDEGKHERMVRCVAAPIRDSRTQVVGALSATTVGAGWEAEHRAAMIRAVVEVTHSISATLGAPEPAKSR